MTNSTENIRMLTAEDLAQVIEIDEKNTGRSRKDFFEKRIKAALKHPKDFIYIAHENEVGLMGYLLARLQTGEFGDSHTVAVLDDIGVRHDAQGKGVGHHLMDELVRIIREKNIHEIRSQADWPDRPVLNFFGASGFDLAPRVIYRRDVNYLDRKIVEEDENQEMDFSDPSSDGSAALSRDKIPCRSLTQEDLAAIIKIDRKIMGFDRTSYYDRKMEEILTESGIRVSLVAECDDHVVGFIMVRVDFGEFGRAEPSAIMDSLGVDPAYAHNNVGSALMSQLMANLAVLRTDEVRTEVDASQLALTGFLQSNGFEPAQSLSLSKKTL